MQDIVGDPGCLPGQLARIRNCPEVGDMFLGLLETSKNPAIDVRSTMTSLTFPTKLNTRPHSSEDVNGNIDDLGPVKPLSTASCSRSSVFLLFSRNYHSGLLSVTSSFTIELPEEQVRRLRDLAHKLGTTPEDVLCTGVQEWLTSPATDFAHAASYVLKKNAELYRRLS